MLNANLFLNSLKEKYFCFVRNIKFVKEMSIFEVPSFNYQKDCKIPYNISR